MAQHRVGPQVQHWAGAAALVRRGDCPLPGPTVLMQCKTAETRRIHGGDIWGLVGVRSRLSFNYVCHDYHYSVMPVFLYFLLPVVLYLFRYSCMYLCRVCLMFSCHNLYRHFLIDVLLSLLLASLFRHACTYLLIYSLFRLFISFCVYAFHYSCISLLLNFVIYWSMYLVRVVCIAFCLYLCIYLCLPFFIYVFLYLCLVLLRFLFLKTHMYTTPHDLNNNTYFQTTYVITKPRTSGPQQPRE